MEWPRGVSFRLMRGVWGMSTVGTKSWKREENAAGFMCFASIKGSVTLLVKRTRQRDLTMLHVKSPFECA